MPAIATMVVQGASGTWPQTNENKVDMASKTYESNPDITPALAIFTKLAKENAFNWIVELLERNELPVVLTLNNAATTGTSLTITTGYRACVANTLIYNPRAGDIASVDTTATTSTVTVTRSAAGTTAASWSAGDSLLLLPTAYVENLDDHDPQLDTASAQGSRIYNYTQISRMYTNRTGLANKTDLVTGESLGTILQGQLTNVFKRRMEFGLLYGGRYVGAAPTTATNTRTAGGLREFLVNGTNYKDFGGSFTESSWDDYLDAYFIENYDAGDVLAFCGPKICTKIFQWGKARGRVELDKQASGYYGFKIDKYDFNGKMVNIVRMPLLGLSASTTNSGFLIDMNRVMLKVMDDMALYENIYDFPMKGENIFDLMRMVWSMLVGTENRHGMFVNG